MEVNVRYIIFMFDQVNQDEGAQKRNSDAGLDGIAGALARALQERSKAIHSSGIYLMNLDMCIIFHSN